jgi:hypothetical protein
MIFTIDEVRYELNMPLQNKKIIIKNTEELRNEINQQNNVDKLVSKKIIIKK